jgi:hypothetical protein
MAWKRVENYWLGYSLPKKQFYFYYKLADESSVQQIPWSTGAPCARGHVQK